MSADFWHQAWAAGRIGFHQADGNAYLAKHAARLEGATRVLVPLCGKTRDLAFLAARGHEVIGVEIVEDAVTQFFDEHELVPEITRGPLTTYRAKGITIFCGDFFALAPAQAGPIDAVYDRAALIALPPELRQPYVDHVRTLASKHARVLLVTLEYPDDFRIPPPYSTEPAVVADLFEGASSFHEIDNGPDARFPDEPGCVERCYAITL